ncbi:MAG: TIGR02594 family protein [Lewinellaceae bacterium]|nr:TIGR02594 family protein [Lewinellaceae bacterium]
MDQYIVIAQKLNIRENPNVNAKVLGQLSNGDIIDEVKISGDGGWVKFERITGSKKQLGWTSLKFLLSLKNDPLIQENDFPWIKVAIREIGIREFYSNADNPRIVQYLQSTDTISNIAKSNDETYWCSAFVNWCIEKAGYEGTSSAWARHWLNWGNQLNNPMRGCVVIFKRGSGGHVGFYIKETNNSIYVLGGNQDDEVNIKMYSKTNLLGYRIIEI